ncbi:ABC transporter permease [Ensifer sp. SSB1]|jgi:peptide/nickel transport system permease protein|uniref:ABC transporter permease n=1 Tax=Ensifer sp. SSB1 TaxID=2795385 RepID=UPI001A59F5BB|nr:ABC transporter permease [Ensifer sp. SSB1]MBK5570622.1 ABC transporter permease [Ensifer sp. SSB1]
MLKATGRRALHGAGSLIGLVILVFFLARLTGDPSALYLPIDATQEAKHEFAIQHGLDKPVIEQFVGFVSGLVHLDFGQSLQQSRPAMEVVLEAFPTTLLLAVFSMTIAVAAAVVIGSLGAWRPGGVFDRIANTLALLGSSTPNFWIAIVGVLVFALWLRLLPTSGTGTVAHWVLPVAVLALRPLGLIAQVVRGAMISALSSAYTKTAKAKGAGNRSIIFVHALRNAMLPVITVAGDQAAGILNGAVIVETVFGFPGVGRLLIDSITYRDFSVLQATVLTTAVAILVMNSLIDFAYALLDPRIRTN